MSLPVPVLMYHSISDRASRTFRRWTVPPARFAEQMEHVASAGYTSLTAAQFAEHLSRGTAPPPHSVVVTFDDGYADFATEAMPVMRANGIRSTLFVTSGYIGGSSEWLISDRETDRPMLTWEQLTSLPSESVELGGHGYSHRQMDTLPVSEALNDIERGMALIEDRTGRPVESFAYPHGYSTPSLRRGLAAMGFTSAHGVVDAMSSTDDRRYSISRIIIDADVSIDQFATLLSGKGLPSHPEADTPRQIAWRWWRRGRIALRIDRPHVPA